VFLFKFHYLFYSKQENEIIYAWWENYVRDWVVDGHNYFAKLPGT